MSRYSLKCSLRGVRKIRAFGPKFYFRVHKTNVGAFFTIRPFFRGHLGPISRTPCIFLVDTNFHRFSPHEFFQFTPRHVLVATFSVSSPFFARAPTKVPEHTQPPIKSVGSYLLKSRFRLLVPQPKKRRPQIEGASGQIALTSKRKKGSALSAR